MTQAYAGFSTRVTAQNEPIPGSAQIPNSAGGFAYGIDDWKRLERFLNLGTEGGSYYASEQKLTKENALATLRCVAADPIRVLNTTVAISDSGRAAKNDPALFVMAMLFGHAPAAVKPLLVSALPQVARIGTHIEHFAGYAEQFRGWGRSLRRAVGNWYVSKPAADLAYQLVKYQSRDKWSHRDLLRLSHPKASGELNDLLHWATQGFSGDLEQPPEGAMRLVWAFERAKTITDPKDMARLIRDFNMPREAVPTPFLKHVDVWEALLDDMPITAMIRNLATMTRVGLLGQMGSPATDVVCNQLVNEAVLSKGRVHPIQILSALRTYAQGHGERSSNSWVPITRVIDALDKAFYLSFKSVVPTGKRIMLALDVSGSMAGGAVAGVAGLTPRDGSAAMALITAATEPNHIIHGFSSEFVPLNISPRQRLDNVIESIDGIPFGRTDCAVPMLWATKTKTPVDAFIVYTDNETWYGETHPVQALRQYREQMGINAKLIVVSMVANPFSIADPNDPNMLDVIGFDTATPNVMSDFIRG